MYPNLGDLFTQQLAATTVLKYEDTVIEVRPSHITLRIYGTFPFYQDFERSVCGFGKNFVKGVIKAPTLAICFVPKTLLMELGPVEIAFYPNGVQGGVASRFITDSRTGAYQTFDSLRIVPPLNVSATPEFNTFLPGNNLTFVATNIFDTNELGVILIPEKYFHEGMGRPVVRESLLLSHLGEELVPREDVIFASCVLADLLSDPPREVEASTNLTLPKAVFVSML